MLCATPFALLVPLSGLGPRLAFHDRDTGGGHGAYRGRWPGQPEGAITVQELVGLYRTACRTPSGCWPSCGPPLLLWGCWWPRMVVP